MTRPKRLIFIAGGGASVGIGVVGVFLPILPTTPFLLLAAYLFARSSDRLYGWLLGNRFVGSYLRRYYERRAMSRRHKAVTLVLLWSVLLATAGLVVGSWWVRGLLGVVGIGVTTHLLMLPCEDATRD